MLESSDQAGVASSPATQEPTFAPEQELRLAVVLYGGVSLAIYMYGIAQELYNLVRATAPSRSYADGEDPPPDLAFAETASTEGVYRELGRMLPLGGATPEGSVRTRFVVDIISGTSAGGINGICLAKALANEADLGQLKEVWLKEGDIGALINDKLSGYYEPPPESLLSGRRMLDKLVGAIRNMTPTRETARRRARPVGHGHRSRGSRAADPDRQRHADRAQAREPLPLPLRCGRRPQRLRR